MVPYILAFFASAFDSVNCWALCVVWDARSPCYPENFRVVPWYAGGDFVVILRTPTMQK